MMNLRFFGENHKNLLTFTQVARLQDPEFIQEMLKKYDL